MAELAPQSTGPQPAEPSPASPDVLAVSPSPAPTALIQRADKLTWKLDDARQRCAENDAALEQIKRYLGIAGQVTDALEQLSKQLFQELLDTVQQTLSIALQEVLEQPITFHAEVTFKRDAASVEFWIEREGNQEDVNRGQGGSVANVLSVGLRMFALTTLDAAKHRRFLVLDEQDCWLRPDLVPRLVKIIRDAGKALGFQVLMISHHDPSVFERYADRVIRLEPGAGSVKANVLEDRAVEEDGAV